MKSKPCSPPKLDGTAPQSELIARLPRTVAARLVRLCKQVPLVADQVLGQPGTVTEFAYFPTQGAISLIATMSGGPGVEVGMVGPEGMLGSALSLNVTRQPLLAVVTAEGSAWRIGARALMHELASNAALRQAMQRYAFMLMTQLVASSVCQRSHAIGPRLARWLLMCSDRTGTPSIAVTQEALAFVLGVRRSGVTLAALALQREGLIAYRRGRLTILDAEGLKGAACGCYAHAASMYADQFP